MSYFSHGLDYNSFAQKLRANHLQYKSRGSTFQMPNGFDPRGFHETESFYQVHGINSNGVKLDMTWNKKTGAVHHGSNEVEDNPFNNESVLRSHINVQGNWRSTDDFNFVKDRFQHTMIKDKSNGRVFGAFQKHSYLDPLGVKQTKWIHNDAAEYTDITEPFNSNQIGEFGNKKGKTFGVEKLKWQEFNFKDYKGNKKLSFGERFSNMQHNDSLKFGAIKVASDTAREVGELAAPSIVASLLGA